jgi:uncharacterized repeat protein (TIGR01451 family)
MAPNREMFVRFLTGLGVLLVIGSAAAQGTDDLEIVLEQRKIVVDASGREKTEAAESSRPGDVIEYVATYRNKGKNPARQIEGTVPVPEGMEFTGKQSGPSAFLASLDGQRFALPPLKRRVKTADGREISVDALDSDYKALRWQLGDLAPGKSLSVSARMRLNPVNGPVAAGTAIIPGER